MLIVGNIAIIIIVIVLKAVDRTVKCEVPRVTHLNRVLKSALAVFR
jgi:hypothetical protein